MTSPSPSEVWAWGQTTTQTWTLGPFSVAVTEIERHVLEWIDNHRLKPKTPTMTWLPTPPIPDSK